MTLKRTGLSILAFLLLGGGLSRAQSPAPSTSPSPTPTPTPTPGRSGVDTTGWTLLGEADLVLEHSVTRLVARAGAGTFNQFMVVAQGDSFRLDRVRLGFSAGEATTLKIPVGAKAAMVLDLPGDGRELASVDLAYRELASGGSARVRVFGRSLVRGSWDRSGWVRLGAAGMDVSHGTSLGRLVIEGKPSKYSKLLFAVEGGSSVLLREVAVRFGDGTVLAPKTRFAFGKATATVTIDVPTEQGGLKSITFKHVNGTAARLELYGKPDATAAVPAPAPSKAPSPAPAPSRAPSPSPAPSRAPSPSPAPSREWRLVGEKEVSFSRVTEIPVIIKGVAATSLQFVVSRGELTVSALQIVLDDGVKLETREQMVFSNTSRARVFDIPAPARAITRVKLVIDRVPSDSAHIELHVR